MIIFLPPRQWKLQRERLQADFTKALDNFQRAQRSAAQKEKEAIKKYKNQGVSLLMHKQVMNLENKKILLASGIALKSNNITKCCRFRLARVEEGQT